MEILSSPEFITLVTNVGVFLATAGTVIAAIWSAAKKVKAAMPLDSKTISTATVTLDPASLIVITEPLHSLEKEVRELRFAVVQLTNTWK